MKRSPEAPSSESAVSVAPTEKSPASVCGLYLAHPDADYFNVGVIGRDQVEDYAARKGVPVDEAALATQERAIIDTFERQQGAIATSALMLDDGVIDPRDTRAVLGLCLTLCDESAWRTLRPVQFGVARP